MQEITQTVSREQRDALLLESAQETARTALARVAELLTETHAQRRAIDRLEEHVARESDRAIRACLAATRADDRAAAQTELIAALTSRNAELEERCKLAENAATAAMAAMRAT